MYVRTYKWSTSHCLSFQYAVARHICMRVQRGIEYAELDANGLPSWNK